MTSIGSYILNKLTGKSEIPDVNVPMEIRPPSLEEATANYNEAFYRHQEQMFDVDSKPQILQSINGSHLSTRCKRAWTDLVHSFYDRNVLLSDLTGQKIKGGTSSDEQVVIAFLRAKVNLMGAIYPNSKKSDRMKPEFMKLETLILDQMWYRLTRCRGTDRERMSTGRIEINYNAKQTLTPQKVQ